MIYRSKVRMAFMTVIRNVRAFILLLMTVRC